MATGIIASSGQDFDNIFERGGGNQLFGIYANDGQDIGQRYYNVSDGNAYGATGFQASDGGDVGYKLCKAGTRNIFTMNVGRYGGGAAYYGYSQRLGIGSLSPNTLYGYTITDYRENTDSEDYLALSGNACPWNKIIVQVIGESDIKELVPNRSRTSYESSVGGIAFASIFYYGGGTVQFKLTPA